MRFSSKGSAYPQFQEDEAHALTTKRMKHMPQFQERKSMCLKLGNAFDGLGLATLQDGRARQAAIIGAFGGIVKLAER